MDNVIIQKMLTVKTWAFGKVGKSDVKRAGSEAEHNKDIISVAITLQ